MRARLSAAPCLVLAGMALAAGACDWRDFDKIENGTPVLAVGAPSHFGASDFGRTILPLSSLAAGATGGRYLVSGAEAPALAIINVDAKGVASGQNVSSETFSGSAPLTALAEVAGTNKVLLGSPGSGGAVYVLTMGTTNEVALFEAPQGADRFGMGVAAGKLAGADAPDFVVASGADLTVFVDGDVNMPVPATPPADSCPMLVPTNGLPSLDQGRRAVVVAPLTGDPGVQIVVGTPSVSDAGAVNVFTVDATGLATCAFSYRNADHLFGQALATGDFDADGVLDLLVGSPPSHAFWIKGPLTAASAVLPVTLAAGTDQLGFTVAAANVDGVPGDEALIGNPDATVGSAALAGEVRIVGGAALDRELPVLRRHDPAASDVFGIDVGALPFCTSKCGTSTAVTRSLLLVGSNARAMTYFLLLPGDKDPRTP
jgi:FG-GAP repeat